MSLPLRVALKNGQMATVRAAAPADAEAWNRLYHEVASEGVYLMTDRASRSVEETRTLLASAGPGTGLWLVADREGTIVAAAGFHRGSQAKNAHTANLGVFVRSGDRGLGLGEALLVEGIRWCRDVGITKLKLGVFASNDRALALYRKLGFLEEARLKGEVILAGRAVDEILMARWL